MNEISVMALSVGEGIVLGLIFYGGLWWTVTKGLTLSRSHWWFLGSFWLRLAIAVGGFYLVAQGDWKNLLACFFGFMLARVATMFLTKGPAHAV